MNWIFKMIKKATQLKAEENAEEQDKQVQNDMFKDVMDIDEEKLKQEAEVQQAGMEEAHGFEKEAAYNLNDTEAETVKLDYKLEISGLSDYNLAEMLAESETHDRQSTTVNFNEEKEKQLKAVKSDRSAAETKVFNLVKDHTLDDWKKAFKNISDYEHKVATEEELRGDGAKKGDWRTNDKDFKAVSDDDKEKDMEGVGGEEEKGQVGKEAAGKMKCPECDSENITPAEGHKLNKCDSCHTAFDNESAKEASKKEAVSEKCKECGDTPTDPKTGKCSVCDYNDPTASKEASKKKAYKIGDVLENCECNGEARLSSYQGDVAILKCDDCGDTFEAAEKFWKKEKKASQKKTAVKAKKGDFCQQCLDKFEEGQSVYHTGDNMFCDSTCEENYADDTNKDASKKKASEVYCSNSDCESKAHDKCEGKYYCPKHLPEKTEKKADIAFRDIPENEKEDYRQWARDNATPEHFSKSELYHPLVREEWDKMGVDWHDKTADENLEQEIEIDLPAQETEELPEENVTPSLDPTLDAPLEKAKEKVDDKITKKIDEKIEEKTEEIIEKIEDKIEEHAEEMAEKVETKVTEKIEEAFEEHHEDHHDNVLPTGLSDTHEDEEKEDKPEEPKDDKDDKDDSDKDDKEDDDKDEDKKEDEEEIFATSSKKETLKKIAEVDSPWKVVTDEQGVESIARVAPKNTKESKDDENENENDKVSKDLK